MLAVPLALVLTATSAHAHYQEAKHGDDLGWVDANHWTIGVCDNEADGNGVRTEYRTADGNTDYVGDWNGSGNGCNSEVVFDGSYVTQFQVCEETKGCSGWKNA
ncbi:hypothetical protein BBK82_20855 [Lentzea guizhouensis]|uniref:Secreted protein n=1 Tax=Lentzea guizhouensis TaxID=1586287 RepID=A0A1B2HK97_9PSEU|nr:hypothetical protein BBK82_20855 [Lentzea guizhouensis]